MFFPHAASSFGPQCFHSVRISAKEAGATRKNLHPVRREWGSCAIGNASPPSGQHHPFFATALLMAAPHALTDALRMDKGFARATRQRGCSLSS